MNVAVAAEAEAEFVRRQTCGFPAEGNRVKGETRELINAQKRDKQTDPTYWQFYPIKKQHIPKATTIYADHTQLIADFLANGGTITKVPPSARPKQVMKSRSKRQIRRTRRMSK
jgi:hypothetical protein